ncbi:DUF4395 domain-containing protein [Streptomyces sp. P9-A2]|uniref:DUF4395 domain-containing protein n=1 Tax=Streptomyces sp. P9-A2 TaxID=3072284 RepID=UPI002FCC5E2C
MDARGPRFGAAMTIVVPAVVPVTGDVRPPAGQTPAFTRGTTGGAGRSPYGRLFRHAQRPRVGPATDFEAPEPPRFTQAVRPVFAGVRLAGFTLGPGRPGLAVTCATLAAAFHGAVFAYRPGCEMRLLLRRTTAHVG